MTADLALMFGLCAGVGVLSSILGVGGGILLVPIFTLIFKMPLIQALALSLCSVMATSVTSSMRYLPGGLVDVKAALYLEIPTILASYFGAHLAGVIDASIIGFVFAMVLLATAVAMFLPSRTNATAAAINIRRFPVAIGASGVAGTMVGLLGIGGGVVQVPILQLCLGKTVKQAVATSTLMLGISAAVGVLPYVDRGNLPFGYVPFTALGTIGGAYLGSAVFHRIESLYIKLMFAAILIYTAINMIIKSAS